jgi:large subunit ribosomal protein L24
MQRFQVGDKVKITAGKDKGRSAVIEKVYPKKNKVLIPGINIYKKHLKGFSGQKAGIYDIPRPLSYSKIAIMCPSCKKPTRVGFKYAGEEKVRFCKKCGKEMRRKKNE